MHFKDSRGHWLFIGTFSAIDVVTKPIPGICILNFPPWETKWRQKVVVVCHWVD